MTERDILSNPILVDIYDQLIEGWQYLDQPAKIKRQAIELIKQLLLRKVLVYYKVPQWFMLSLTSDETQRLYKVLKTKYDRLGQTVSDEEIKQEIEQINILIDQVIEEIVTEEKNND